MLYFSKMHGTGNDYVYVNCLEQQIDHPAALARRVSDRHFGVGADGLVMILPSATADFGMRMFNADGSEGGMCGNAIRCVGKYLYDRSLTAKTRLEIETASGVRRLRLLVEEGAVRRVAVDMGAPLLRPEEVPLACGGNRFVNRPVEVNGATHHLTCLSMGNPHAVLFVDDTDSLELDRLGPHFERHPLFPQRVNTEFVQVLSPHRIRMRVWERGSGETMACGTGACAAVVACVLTGRCTRGSSVQVCLRGGELQISWTEGGSVTMEGPATHVFDGALPWPEQRHGGPLPADSDV